MKLILDNGLTLEGEETFKKALKSYEKDTEYDSVTRQDINVNSQTDIDKAEMYRKWQLEDRARMKKPLIILAIIFGSIFLFCISQWIYYVFIFKP
ncbi:hypothetical protein LQZ19_06070 [Treponema primitia]|uniref:hypothetical protein n=1 Tax=Treponema primitia TaxID=88058 RepID=UPI00397EF2A6